MPDPIPTLYVARTDWERHRQRAEAAEADARRRAWEAGILRYLCIVLVWVAVMALAVWKLSPLIEGWAAG